VSLELDSRRRDSRNGHMFCDVSTTIEFIVIFWK